MGYITDNYSIIISKSAGVKAEFAAGELQYFIQQACGLQLKIRRALNGTPYGERYIALSLLSEKKLKGGFRVQNYDGNINIFADSENTLIYGVYGFLKKVAGLEIFSDDCFKINTTDKLYIPDDFTLDEIPDIPVRTIGINPVHCEDKIIDRVDAGVKAGINRRYIYRMRLQGMCEGWGLSGHTYFKILPPEKYRSAHPDWYYFTEKGNVLCLTSVSMREQFVKNMKEIILAAPLAERFMIGQEDNAVFCECESCKKALKRLKNSKSALMLEFTNDIAKRLNKWLKEECGGRKVDFVTFAYITTAIPPVKIIKNGDSIQYRPLVEGLITEDNLAVMMAPLYTSTSYGLFDDRNRISFESKFFSENSMKTKDFLMAWKTVCKKTCLWTYSIDFTNYAMPFFIWDTVEDDYKNIVKYLQPEFMFAQGAYSSCVPNLKELKIYVFSKMMWDSSSSVDELVKDFIGNYYGAAAGYLTEYFNAVNAHCRHITYDLGRPFVYIRFDDVEDLYIPKYWQQDVLEGLIKIFDDGMEYLQALGNVDQVYLQRFLKESMGIKYLMLRNYRDVLPGEYKERLHSDIHKIAEYNGVKGLCEYAENTICEVVDRWVYPIEQ